MFPDLNTKFTDHIVSAINNLLPRLPSALFDLVLGILLIRLVVRTARLVMKATRVQPGFRQVLTSLIEIVLWLILAIAILTDLGYSGVIYFFGGSIAVIGIAMAAGGSTLVSDIIAGIFLARDRDFNVGDEVIVGETPTLGVVEHMDARRTRLRDNNDILHVIPNSVVERKEWVVVRRRAEVSAFVKATKAAKRIGAVARARSVAARRKSKDLRKNEQ